MLLLITYNWNNFELLKVKNIQIPTVDELGNVTWGEVTAITRHDPGAQLFEIVTKSGRKVIVPESKSLLIWNEETNKFENKLTPNVVLGDKVPVTMKLCNPPIITRQVDMTQYFSKTEYIYGTDFIMDKAMEKRDKIPTGWWERSNNDNVQAGYLYSYGTSKENVLIPDKFELDKINGQFIGLFLADGNIDFESGYIQITKSDEKTLKFVEDYFKSLNISYKRNKKISERGTINDVRG